MSLYSIQDTTLTDIADAIRSKTGKTASMTPAEMVDEIESISGGTSVRTATGTVSGSEAIRLSIPCDFEPDLIYVHGDLTGSASLRGVVSVTIIKDTLAIITCDGSQNNTDEFLYNVKYGITGLNESDSAAIHASYSDGYITIDAVDNTTNCRFNSSVTYAYKFVKWT